MAKSHRLLQVRLVEIYTYEILLMTNHGDCYRRGLQRMEIPERSDAFEAWLSQSSQVSLFKNLEDFSGHLDYKKAEFFLLHLQFQFMLAGHSNCKWGDLF